MLRFLVALSLLLQAFAVDAIDLCPGASGAAPWDQSLLNDTARVLAGLDAPLESTLAATIDPAELARHRATLGKSWAELRTRQLDAVSAFGTSLFGKGKSAPQRVFYPFSGPDALYLVSLFPDARASVLTGLEPVGTVPVLADLSAQEIESSLAELRKSLYAILSFSFFRTNDLTVDLKRNRFVGVTPILFTFMAQAGYAIFDVRYVLLTPNGSVCQADAAQIAKPPAAHLPGVEIEYFAPGHADFRKLTYFAADIGDGGLRKTPQYLDYIHSFSPDATYLKSASYLMHKSYFSLIRKLILDESELVLQDDSGIPHGWFRPQLWEVQLYGRYKGPIGLFRNWYQIDLAEAYEAGDPEPLDFGIGYQHRKNQSNLVLYRKRAPSNGAASRRLK